MWFLIVAFLPVARAGERLGCTALAIDGAATTNGGAFAVENTDCNDCDFRLNFVEPRNHSVGDKRPVYLNPVNYPRFVGYGRGEMYHPEEGQKLTPAVGYIPQVTRTFGYYESVAPLMNDQGLGMGESSCGAMLQNKPPHAEGPGVVGILDAMTMMQLALERCATARCAVDVMGDLAETYGYLPFGGEPTFGTLDGRPFWADSGEGYTIADASGEAWVLSMLGGVEGVTKSVWAAQRVPKGHFAVVANEFTMGEIPSEPNDDFRFSSKIFEAAIKAKLWNGKGNLHFANVFAPDPTTYATNGGAPIPLYSSLRRWRHMNLVAPASGVTFEMDHRKYPVTIKVERPLSHRDVMSLMKDHYAGTEFDMTQGILAGPYSTPFRVEGGPKFGQVPRGFSILRTLYSTISETGPSFSRLWYAPDTPATSVYVPLDCRSGASIATPYAIGHNREFDRHSAWWAFGFVNNWMQLNYKGMSEADVLPRIEAWQDRIDRELIQVQNVDPAELRDWQVNLQEEIFADWLNLADHLVMKYNDMSVTTWNRTDGALGYPEPYAKMVGMTNDVHPLWVQPAAKPEGGDCQGYVEARVPMPRSWDPATEKWEDWTRSRKDRAATQLVNFEADVQPSAGLWVVLVSGLMAMSALLGYLVGRRQQTSASEDFALLR